MDLEADLLLYKNVQLYAKYIVEGYLIGLHKSPYHGFSVEFAEHRLYQRGDNLKHIDWRVFGRTDRLYTKKYEEEINLKCMMLIDVSSSMYFPLDQKKNKLQFALKAALCLSHLLQLQSDAVGMTMIDDNLSTMIPPKTGVQHQHLLLSTIEHYLNKKEKIDHTTALATQLEKIQSLLSRRNLVILFTDFQVDDADLEKILAQLVALRHAQHEALIFEIGVKSKEFDFQWENNAVTFVDMETSMEVKVQPQLMKELYINKINERRNRIKEWCLNHQIDHIIIDTTEPVSRVLQEYLFKRNKLSYSQ